jgi:hypothetical protein
MYSWISACMSCSFVCEDIDMDELVYHYDDRVCGGGSNDGSSDGGSGDGGVGGGDESDLDGSYNSTYGVGDAHQPRHFSFLLFLFSNFFLFLSSLSVSLSFLSRLSNLNDTHSQIEERDLLEAGIK